MKSSIFKQFAIVAIACVAAVSCKENDIVYDTDFEGKELRTINFAAPIAKVHVPIYESLDKQMDIEGLSKDETGLIYVSFTHTQSVQWTKDIGVDALTKTFSYPLPEVPEGLPEFPKLPEDITVPGLPLSNYSWQKDGSETIKLTTNGETTTTIDTVTFSDGQLDFSLTLPLRGKLHIEIPELTTNGVPFTIDEDLQPNITNVFKNSLVNGKIRTSTQTLTINYSITVTSDGLPSPGEAVEMGIDLNIEDLQSMFGYFGTMDASPDETNEFEFDFFEDLGLKQSVGLKDITIKAGIVNNVGVPMLIDVSTIKMFNNDVDLGTSLKLTPEFKVNVDPATYANNQLTPVLTTKEINASLEFSDGKFPNRLVFDVTGTGNPPNMPKAYNFIEKSDKLVDIDLEILVPLHVKTGAYQRQDTIDFDFNDLIDDDESLSKSVEKVVLYLDINNGLPFEIKLSGVALDPGDKPISPILISEQTIKSGKPEGTSGKVTPTRGALEITLTQTQIEQLRIKDAKKIILITESATYGSDYVKIYNDAALDIDVSVSFKANIPSSIF